jgi:hypothetical protein
MTYKRALLATACAAALLGSGPALAQDTNNAAQTQAANQSSDRDVQVVRDNDGDLDYPNHNTMTINHQMTAAGLIGRNVRNQNGKTIATVEDIILGPEGQARMVVLNRDTWTGMMGKRVAYDYNAFNRIPRSNDRADIVASITEADLERAPKFSYERDTEEANTQTIPADHYSADALMDAYLLDQDEERLADVINVSFQDGRADQVIVDVDEVWGVTAHKVALPFDEVRLTKNGEGEPQFLLTAAQARSFKDLKKEL